MEDFDPYKVLNVPKHATTDEVNAAYKRLAREWHPDKKQDDPNATEKFKQIGFAKEILLDSVKRRTFDKYGMAGILNPESIQNRDTRKVPNMPLYASCSIDLLTVESGTTVQVPVERHTFRPIDGSLISVGTEQVNVTVTIPQGIEDGMVLTVQNEGHRFEGEVDRGNVSIGVKIQKHTIFKREGPHLVVHLPVTIPDVIYPTLFTIKDLRNNDLFIGYDPVQKDTSITPGNNIRIVSGKGLPHLRDPAMKGDMYIVFDILLPPAGCTPNTTIGSIQRSHKSWDSTDPNLPALILSMTTKPNPNESDNKRRAPVGCVQQ